MIGPAALIAYIATIPLANFLIQHVGTTCIPNGPCVVPVGFGLYCPSGSLMIGLALVLRDIVQRVMGIPWSLGAIAIGAVLAGMVASPSLVVASVTSFVLAELADFGVYTPLQRRRFILAVIASSAIGAVIDSALFLWIAFGMTDTAAVLGVVLGKWYMVLAAYPLMVFIRARTPPQPTMFKWLAS